ncbi:Ejaculatory bulb-specific protein 3 [Eumeta japonica]|uniref:Ejaculatory bulb-specific protein 3 n=1 Tax=Eumeta variegata TaxID=151549 RepID=A0A4C1T3H4_EUMVA|nr:Ejaculatory bulb-specific protein 3 [Eumeta japonica]
MFRNDLMFPKDSYASTMNGFTTAIAFVTFAQLVLCYDEKYDKIDVDKIIEDDALFDAYIDCMLDKGPCTAEHSPEFRKLLPEVVATACAKCSPIQKSHVRKTVMALQNKRPVKFQEFTAKYDPNGEYVAAFTDFVLEKE